MSVIFSIGNLSRFLRINPVESNAPAVATRAPASDAARLGLLQARGQLLSIYRALEKLADVASIETRRMLDLPDARSTTGLGLDLSTTAATLASAGEINESVHSFSPFGPDWTDGSSALMTIGGEYDGSNGTGNLGFEVRRAGTKGVDNLRIRVFDPAGDRIRNINIRANHDPDREYSLQNGLFLKLGAGQLINRDVAEIQVFQSVGSVFDPNNPLAGLRNSNPNFQYYASPNTLDAVVDGAFLLNNKSISVDATDTLYDVIDRINLSAAGVTANFNSATEQLELIQNSTGSAPAIDIQGDTSNFVESTKLSAANVVAGIDPENTQSINNVTAFSAVQSGEILINNTPISIDTATDSLAVVIDRINNSSAGVTAEFNLATQKVQIEANETATVLRIDSNGTGFFPALHMPEGRVDPEAVSRGISRRRSYEIADALQSALFEVNKLFRDRSFTGNIENAAMFRNPVDSAMRRVFGNSADISELFGVQFDQSDDAKKRGGYTSLNRSIFTSGLQLQGDNVTMFLGGNEQQQGLVASLYQGVKQSLTSINSALGFSSSIIDDFV